MAGRADRALAAMRTDTASDWHRRLAAVIGRAPLVDERELTRFGHSVTHAADLTPMQLRILTAASHGMGQAEAAALIGITYDAVGSAQKVIRRKLRAKTVAHAVALALRQGLIT